MNDAPYHHGNLRSALIEAALRVIGDAGAEAVTLRGLARELGVSHAAPSRHFASRDALFAAIAEGGYEQLSACVAQACDPTAGPVTQLTQMIEAHLRWVRAHAALYLAMRNPEVTRHADAGLRGRMQALTQNQRAAVQAARATGWRHGEEAEVTFLGIVGGLVGLGSVLTDPFLSSIIAAQDIDRLTSALAARLTAP